MAYCTNNEVRRRASGGSGSGGSATTTALSEDELTALVEQASRYFDLVCGVEPEYFEAAGASATDLVVYGDGTHFLKLPPRVAGSVNATLTLPEGYTAPTFIERDGYLVISSSGVMAHRIAPFPSPFYGGWYSGVPITVSAKWGFLETPADVNMAVIELILNLFRETDPASVKLVGLEGQPLREWMPPRTAAVAKRYRMTGVAFV